MKKILFLLTTAMIFSIFSSCNKDDEIFEEIVEEITVQILNESLDIVQEGDYQKLTVSFTTERNPQEITASIHPNGIAISFDINSNNIYERILNLDRNDLPEGTHVSVTIFADNQTKTTNTVVVHWEEPITNEEDTVKFGEFVQTSNPNEFFKGSWFFTDNTKPGGRVLLKILTTGGELLGEFVRTLATANGFVETGEIDLEQNQTYQLLATNVDTDNPDYGFIDSFGNIVNSIVIEFTTSENNNTVTMGDHVVSEITDTSLKIDAIASTNFDTEETIFLRWYVAGGTTAIGTIEIPIPAGGNDVIISETVSDLTASTLYDLRYFLNNNSEPFYQTTVETAAENFLIAVMENHSVTNVTETTVKLDGLISTNFETEETIYLKWFTAGAEIGSIPILTPLGGGNVVVDEIITGLIPSTAYGIKYFIDSNGDGNLDMFYETNVTTASAGTVQFNFGVVLDLNPNGFELQTLSTNQSDGNVVVELRAWNVDNEVISNFTMTPGMVNFQSVFTASGFEQNSNVNYEAKINDVVVDSGSLPTPLIGYSNIKNLNSSGGLDPEEILSGTQGTMAISQYDTDGTGNIVDIIFQFSTTTGFHPSYYLETLGINVSQNIVVSNPSSWFEVSTGVYEATLTNANVEILNGLNALAILSSRKPYVVQSTVEAFDEFSLKIMIVDNAGTTQGTEADPLILKFYN